MLPVDVISDNVMPIFHPKVSSMLWKVFRVLSDWTDVCMLVVFDLKKEMLLSVIELQLFTYRSFI